MQISSGHLTRQCKMCGSSLTNTESKQSVESGLAVFRSIAQHHKFMLLLETTEWVLQFGKA